MKQKLSLQSEFGDRSKDEGVNKQLEQRNQSQIEDRLREILNAWANPGTDSRGSGQQVLPVRISHKTIRLVSFGSLALLDLWLLYGVREPSRTTSRTLSYPQPLELPVYRHKSFFFNRSPTRACLQSCQQDLGRLTSHLPFFFLGCRDAK